MHHSRAEPGNGLATAHPERLTIAVPDLREMVQSSLGDTYRIEHELSGGGMSRVFVASETALDRQVVIKVLPAELTATVSIERFRREIHFAASLQHPHIVPVLSAGTAGGLLYYSMPFIRGDSLKDRLAHDEQLPIAEVIRLLREVAEALAYAHEQGVVHRDIKPGNILFSDGHALITDFGVARALDDATGSSSLTSAGLALGTPLYMAPEQAIADPNADHRVDIYALGVVAYEALTGQPPFAGGSAKRLLAAHVTELADPVAQRRHDVPRALNDVVMRCLEKLPSDRWQTARELLTHLEGIVSSPGQQGPTGFAALPLTSVRLRRRARVRERLAATTRWWIVAVAVACAAALATMWPRRAPIVPSSRVLVVPFRNDTGDSTLTLVGPMVAQWITEALAQTGLVDVIDSRTMLDATKGVFTDATVRQFATRAGVTTLVVGSVFRDGDSLRFESQITDADDGRLRQAIKGVMAPVGRPTAALESLRQSVTGALAVMFDQRLHNWAATATQPPTWAAYQEFLLGMRDFGRDYEPDMAHFRRAIALDSSYSQARLWLGIANANLRRYAEADSIFRSLTGTSDRLVPYDRATLDYFQRGFVDGDWEGAYRGATRMVELAPNAGHALYALGLTSQLTLRATGCLATLRRIDITHGWGAEWAPRVLNLTARCEHLLGRHSEELVTARRLRQSEEKAGWTRMHEIRALAALHRHDELAERLRSAMTVPASVTGWEPFSPGDMLLEAAREEAAHGDVAAMRPLLQQAERWYNTLSPAARATAGNRRELARVLYAAGEWNRAGDIFSDLLRTDSTNPEHLGGFALAAVRQGDSATGRAALERLRADDRPWQFGNPQLWAARIAAGLGRPDQAVLLVRESLDRGFSRSYRLHAEPDFLPLKDFGPFREVLQPRR